MNHHLEDNYSTRFVMMFSSNSKVDYLSWHELSMVSEREGTFLSPLLFRISFIEFYYSFIKLS